MHETSANIHIPHFQPIKKADSSIAAAARRLVAAKRMLGKAKSSGKALNKEKQDALADKIAEMDDKLLVLRSEWGQASIRSLKAWVRAREIMSATRVDALAGKVSKFSLRQASQQESLDKNCENTDSNTQKLEELWQQLAAVEKSLPGFASASDHHKLSDAVSGIHTDLEHLKSQLDDLRMQASLTGADGGPSEALRQQLARDRAELVDMKAGMTSVRADMDRMAKAMQELRDRLASLDALKALVAQQGMDMQQLQQENAQLASALETAQSQNGQAFEELRQRLSNLETQPHTLTIDAIKAGLPAPPLLSRQIAECCELRLESPGAESGSKLANAIDAVVATLRHQIESKWLSYSNTVDTVAGPLGWNAERLRKLHSDSEDEGDELDSEATSPREDKHTAISQVLGGLMLDKKNMLSSHILLAFVGSALGRVQELLAERLEPYAAAEVFESIEKRLTHQLLESDVIFRDMAGVFRAFLLATHMEAQGAAPSDDTALGRVACVACNRPASAIAPPSRPMSRTLRSSPQPPTDKRTRGERPQSAAPVLGRARAPTDSDSRASSPTSPLLDSAPPFSMGGGFRVKPATRGHSMSASTSPDMGLAEHQLYSARSTGNHSARPASAHFDSRGRPSSAYSGMRPGKVKLMAHSPGHTGMTREQSRRVKAYGAHNRPRGGVSVTPGVHPGVDLGRSEDISPSGMPGLALPTIWTAGQFPSNDATRVHRQSDPVLLNYIGDTAPLVSGRSKAKPLNLTAARAASESGLGKVTGWANDQDDS